MTYSKMYNNTYNPRKYFKFPQIMFINYNKIIINAII